MKKADIGIAGKDAVHRLRQRPDLLDQIPGYSASGILNNDLPGAVSPHTSSTISGTPLWNHTP